MASGSGGGEKTEKPTPKKLKQARKDGQIPRSPDPGAWAAILVAAWVMPWLVESTYERCRHLLLGVTDTIAQPTTEKALAMLVSGAGDAALAMGPFCGVLLAVAFAGSVLQGGVHVVTKNLKPQWSRMSPKQAAKRMLGTQALWELTKMLVKSAVVAFLVWRAVAELLPAVTGSTMPLSSVVGTVGDSLFTLVRNVAAAALLMGLADYAWQRRKVGQQLKMSHQEIKDEHKQTEGDPLVKGAIRSRQLAMSRNRMMAEVVTADVVLVNPTHVAVALRYEPDRGAPRVVAKGAGLLAARIRGLAEEHRVPLVQDVPLARALYGACEVGDEVPPELFTAVARVLAFVMSLRRRGSAAGTHTVPTPAPTLPEVGRRRRGRRRALV